MIGIDILLYSYVVIGFLSLYFFDKFLRRFFEYRDIPDFWKLFFWGVSIYWVSDALLPVINLHINFESFDVFYALMQPIGPALAMYAVYKIEEETKNV